MNGHINLMIYTLRRLLSPLSHWAIDKCKCKWQSNANYILVHSLHWPITVVAVYIDFLGPAGECEPAGGYELWALREAPPCAWVFTRSTLAPATLSSFAGASSSKWCRFRWCSSIAIDVMRQHVVCRLVPEGKFLYSYVWVWDEYLLGDWLIAT